MGASEILQQLARSGLRLSLDGENVRVEPKAAITPEVRDLIRHHKPGIVAALQRGSSAGTVPPELRSLIDNVARVREWSAADKLAAVEEWHMAPTEIERALRHLLAFYGEPTRDCS